MITDADIKKLKKVFATKDDLLELRLLIQQDTKKLVTEAISTNNEAVMSGIRTIIDMLAETTEKAAINSNEVKAQRVVLGDHEQRLQRLEKVIV